MKKKAKVNRMRKLFDRPYFMQINMMYSGKGTVFARLCIGYPNLVIEYGLLVCACNHL